MDENPTIIPDVVKQFQQGNRPYKNLQPQGGFMCATANCKTSRKRYATEEELKKHQEQYHSSGPKCSYCEATQKYQKIANDYLASFSKEKPNCPFLEELALKLGISEVGLWKWVNKKIESTNELEHPELVKTVDSLKTLQKMWLKKRTLGRFNPRGAIFLLSADHDVIEKHKNVHAGDINEPLEIIIVDEGKKNAE